LLILVLRRNKTVNHSKRKTNKTISMVAFAFTVLALFILTGGASLPLQAQTDSAEKQAPAVTHNTWTSGAAMPTAVNWPAVGVIKANIYVVGGYTGGPASTGNQIYDAVTNSWSSGAPIPDATAQAAAAVVKNILYVIGGSNNGGPTVFNTVWAYNPKTNTWTSKAAMPTARCSVTAVVANNIIYAIGGYNNGARLTTVEAYDPATDTWTEEAGLLDASRRFQPE
jgi:N-acetylneuraminic acid mutarotase